MAKRNLLQKLGRLVCLVLIPLALLASYTNSHASEDACPDWISEDAPILKQSGIYSFSRNPEKSKGSFKFSKIYADLSELAYRKVYNVWLEVPLGYIQPWAHASKEGALLDKSRVYDETPTEPVDRTRPNFTGIGFWMPDLRFVERNLKFLAWRKPCEFGRPPPTESNYVVDVAVYFPPGGNDFGKSSIPIRLQALRNEIEDRYSDPSRYTDTIDFIVNSEGQASGEKTIRVLYSNEELAAGFRCSAFTGEKAHTIPLCTGWVWEAKSNTTLWLRIPSNLAATGNPDFWKEPSLAAVSLVKSWVIKVE